MNSIRDLKQVPLKKLHRKIHYVTPLFAKISIRKQQKFNIISLILAIGKTAETKQKYSHYRNFC